MIFCLALDPEDFTLMIFSETFKGFCVRFKPVIYFELIFVEWDTGQDPFFFPLPMNANYSNTICCKRYICSPTE